MSWELWDNFDFDTSSDNFREEMIKQGALNGIGLGLSQTRTRQELRDRGFAFGNERFSALWNGLRDDNQGFNHFSTINMDTLAFDDVLPQRDYFQARYRYVASFTAYDEFGRPTPRHTVAFDSNKQYTPREALEALADTIAEFYGVEGEELDSLQLQGAIYNPNFALESR